MSRVLLGERLGTQCAAGPLAGKASGPTIHWGTNHPFRHPAGMASGFADHLVRGWSNTEQPADAGGCLSS